MSDQGKDTPLYQLLLNGKRQILPKGEIVHGFEDKTLIHLIKNGYVKRYMIQNDGSRNIQVIYGPNDIVPLTPVYNTIFAMKIYRGQQTYFYEAMTDITLYSISHDTLKDAIETDPLIYKDLFYAAGVRLNSFIHRLEDASITGSHRRVAHLLFYLADLYGKPNKDGGLLIEIPLTQQTIAEILGLARETVTHSILNLRDKGLIIDSGKTFLLPDPAKLQREANK
jgi:CRP/FNR family cyclic AMP-dependent transcriptional regulator